MKSLQQHIEEKLIITTNNTTSILLDLAKKIWSVPQNIDGKIGKDTIQYNWLWETDNGNVSDKLLSFADEILNNINEYDHHKSLVYHKYGIDEHNKNKMLKEILIHANEEELSELLFQSNPRASKNNVQLISIKDDDVMMYIIGKSLFKKGKFNVDNIETFRIIILYND